MKKNLNRLLVVMAAVGVMTGVGCQEKGPLEKAGEKVDDAAQKTSDAIKNAATKTKDAAKDTADKAKAAADDATK